MRWFDWTWLLAVAVFAGCSDEAHRPAPKAGDNDQSKAAGNSQNATGSPDVDGDALGADVSAGLIRLTVPDGWERRQPRSSVLAAEFALPKAEGDDQDGRLTVSLAGGSVEDNLQRWRGQFTGDQKPDAVKQVDVGGLSVSVIDLTGTFNDQAGPFAPAVERPGYRMLGAVVPVDGQLHFIKAYGPAKTMAKHEKAFYAFMETVKRG
jgi:hypothetical protein